MKKYFGLTVLLTLLSLLILTNDVSAQKGKGGCQNKQNCSKFVDANGDGKCDNFVDANNDGKCDNCTCKGVCDGTGNGMGQGKHNCGKFVDANGDGKCDNFVDANNDGKCDDCIGKGVCDGTGKSMGQGKHNCGKFVDANGDGKCDNFVDSNNDGKCDNCTGKGVCDGTSKGMRQGKVKGNCSHGCKMTNNNNNNSNFTLKQNVPNPVVGSTTKVSFNLKEANNVKITLLDKLGNNIKDVYEGNLSAGDHEIELNLAGLNTGNYFYSVFVGGKVQTKQLVVIK
jgi:hypothetical protein